MTEARRASDDAAEIEVGHHTDSLDDVGGSVEWFYARCGLTGRSESFSEGFEPRLPTLDETHSLAESIKAAATADPWAFRILGRDIRKEAIHEDLHNGFIALRKDGGQAKLTSSQRGALEAIVLLSGRPALFIKHDTFDVPEGVWELLAPYRLDMSGAIKAVGRIGVPSHGIPYVGTGFVVGNGLIMTNRHVICPYFVSEDTSRSEDKSRQWKLSSGVKMTIDFRQEFGSAETLEFEIADVEGIHSDMSIDLALLKVNPIGTNSEPLPPPASIQKNAGYVAKTNFIYVVGYPGADTERNDPNEMHRIFSGVYEKKRLAPGRVTSVNNRDKTITHDCSTLGGSSGSCIIDLSTNSVIGLHFKGQYLKENTAVLLPELTSDALLSSINFK